MQTDLEFTRPRPADPRTSPAVHAMKSYTPPIYMHTTGLAEPAAAVIERSAAAGGHEVRAHVPHAARSLAGDLRRSCAVKHGVSQYRAGCRCDVCREGHRIHQERLREAARWKPIPESVHGTAHGYGYWDCRCDRCREAKRASNARDNPVYKARRKATS